MSSPRTPSSTSPDFGSLAATYDRLRPADENWAELLEVLIECGDLLGRRVLEVGCGTGRVAAALAERGARVWGVEPSEEMLVVARETVGPAVGLKRASAESLPFKDGWFERAVLRLVVHLVDRKRTFAELARVLVPSGRAVIASFEQRHFERYWANELFPSIEGIDRARCPAPEELGEELARAGFEPVTVRTLRQEGRHTRAEALEKIRGRYISTLQLIPEDEYRAGLARAEHELPEEISYELDWAVLVAERA